MAKKTKKSSMKKKPIVKSNQWIMITKPFKLKANNFCFPANIKHVCHCGNVFLTDFNKEGLYYPDVNEPFIHTAICKKCLRRMDIKLRLHISLEIIHDEQ